MEVYNELKSVSRKKACLPWRHRQARGGQATQLFIYPFARWRFGHFWITSHAFCADLRVQATVWHGWCRRMHRFCSK